MLKNKPKRIQLDFNADYYGLRNKIPSQAEIVEGYINAKDFFKARCKWHEETASWYFNYADEMEAKAYQHLDLVKIAEQQADEYLGLIATAYLNGFSFHSDKGGRTNAR